MKFKQECATSTIANIFAATALSCCLLGSSVTHAVDGIAADANRSSTATLSGTKWEVRAGDALADIARTIYPNNASMRDKLVRAIIAANPDTFPEGKSASLAVGSTLFIPDLRTLSASETRGAAKMPPDKPKLTTVDKAASFRIPATPVAPVTVTSTATSKKATLVADSPLSALQEQTIPEKSSTGRGFKLKLSTGVMDLSRAGKLNTEELKRLRDGQLLLNADDSMANFPALTQQIKQLETQLAVLQSEMGKSVAPPAPTPVSVAAPVTAAIPASASAPVSIPFIPAAYTPAPSNDTLELIRYALTLYLLPVAEIMLALLALFFVLRYYRNLRERLTKSGEMALAAQNKRLSVLAKAREATAGISSFDKQLAISTASGIEVVEDTNIEAILQDAQLFMIHGYPDKAIGLLEEQIAANHEEVRAWMLLFVILRSQGMRKEFEKFAQRFKKLIPAQSIWENVQDLGRELEPANPLYSNTRHRVGGIPSIAAHSPEDTQDIKGILRAVRNSHPDGAAKAPDQT